MPQLAPMWWTWMYLLFISSLHISIITLFNLNNPKPNPKQNTQITPTKYWTW